MKPPGQYDNNTLYFYGVKIERIYRILLSRIIKTHTWYRIAKEADIEYSYAHTVLKGLERDGIIQGNELKDPKTLFKRWAERKDNRIYREYNIQNPKKVLKNARMDYAITGYFAENLVGHYLFPRYFELYIHPNDALGWDTLLTKNGYSGKGNVKTLLTDEHVFFEKYEMSGWPVVSIQQLIIDLLREGAECTEAANLLIKKVYYA
jgi:hypothetical protein